MLCYTNTVTRENKPLSILFIGNSFSYYNNLPGLVARFARASNTRLVIGSVLRGGATLKMLWDDGEAPRKLLGKTWDYVVLQERGRLGGVIRDGIVHVSKPQVFIAYATRFDKAAKKIGAKTILYCPPAFLGVARPDDTKKLHAAHKALARKLRAPMIPAGAAFMLARRERPSMNLYAPDKHHPNPLGTYLVASLFYKSLFKKRVSGLPLISYFSKSRKLPKNPKLVKISASDARFLWSVANRTV